MFALTRLNECLAVPFLGVIYTSLEGDSIRQLS